jgi:hypothetical protein
MMILHMCPSLGSFGRRPRLTELWAGTTIPIPLCRFTSDLIRHVHPVPLSMEVDFFKAVSYGMGLDSRGFVQLDEHFDLSMVQDKHVLVCE